MNAGGKCCASLLITNIYISALNFGGIPERLLRLAENKTIQLVIRTLLRRKVAKVLGGKKFAWPHAEIENAMSQLFRIADCVYPSHSVSVIGADSSDNRILECAEAGKADLWSPGDTRHVLPLGSHAGIPIIKPSDFLGRVQDEASQQR